MPSKMTGSLRLESALRRHALGYPEAYEEYPWGERAIKVKGKVFIFMSAGAEVLSFSVKLPRSGEFALGLPFTKPTGYGLGKSGWVSARVPRGSRTPAAVFKEWIEESYRAIAPRGLIALLDARSGSRKARAATGRKGPPASKSKAGARARGTRKGEKGRTRTGRRSPGARAAHPA